MNIPDIQNLFRMFHYQLLSNSEQTFNLLEFCVLVDLGIRPKDGWRLSSMKTFVSYACIEKEC